MDSTAFLMPDHLDALVDGTRPDSSFLKCVAMFKQRTAFEYARDRGEVLWHEGFFEHVLRSEDDLEAVAAHIVGNPIRAGLCSSASDYPYLGSSRYTVDQLAAAVQIWPRWKSPCIRGQ
jgi:putative transposase